MILGEFLYLAAKFAGLMQADQLTSRKRSQGRELILRVFDILEVRYKQLLYRD